MATKMNKNTKSKSKPDDTDAKSTSMSMFRDLRASADEKHLMFSIEGVNVAVVNALRRSIISDVPSVAFDFSLGCSDMEIVTNTSPIHNDMLGHRISLIPVCANERQLKAFSDDPRMYTFVLRDKNSGNRTQNVTTSTMQVLLPDGQAVEPSVRDALFPACPRTGDHFLVTKLKPDPLGDEGEVHVRCVASVKTGSEHARWCPVSVCHFTNVVDPEAAEAAFSDLERQHSEKKIAPPSRQNFDALEAKRYYFKDAHGEPRSFEFFLESECGLRAGFIVYMGFRSLLRRVAQVREAVERRDDAVASISPPPRDAPDVGIRDVLITGQDHTLGNLVQALMYERNIRAGLGPIDYVGYHMPHPLEKCIILRVRLTDKKTDVEGFLVDNLRHVELTLQEARDNWVREAGLRDERKGYALDLFP